MDHRTILWETASNVPVARSQPLHLDLYEIKSSTPLLTVPLHSKNIYYAVSTRGTLLVGDGTSLEFFIPPAPQPVAPKH
jgi:hypothetical protein